MISGELAHMTALEHNRELLRTAELSRRIPRRRGRTGLFKRA